MAEMTVAIAQVIEALAWPLVAILAGWMFKGEIRALLSRIRKGGGVEFDPVPQANVTVSNSLPTISSSDIAAVLQLPRTLATLGWEHTIREYLATRNVTDPAQREAALTLIAARAMLSVQFEQTDNAIWASQLALLNHLNAAPGGETSDWLREHFYNPATKSFPGMYENYSFDQYMDFLRRNFLVEQTNTVKITDHGAEFLRWRIEQRKPVKLHG